MTIIGTSHFVSLATALAYYQDYGYRLKDVERKLAEGEIHVGKPELKPGQKLLIIDSGTRYAIEDCPTTGAGRAVEEA